MYVLSGVVHVHPSHVRTGIETAEYELPKVPTTACLTVRFHLEYSEMWKADS